VESLWCLEIVHIGNKMSENPELKWTISRRGFVPLHFTTFGNIQCISLQFPLKGSLEIKNQRNLEKWAGWNGN
jgi:hypothetical protein